MLAEWEARDLHAAAFDMTYAWSWNETLLEITLAHGDPVHGLVPAPGVGHVERRGVQVPRLPLGQHEDGLDRVEFGAHRVPEVGRHEAGDVAAIAVDVDLRHPVLHGLGHVLPELGLGVVQVDDVDPVPPRRRPEVALPVPRIPLRMLGHQVAVPRRVVGHPVQDDVQAVLVRGPDEVLQVIQRAQLGLDRVVVLDRVGTAQRALAVLLADHLNRHQPQDDGAEFLQPRQVGLGGPEGAFRGELAGVDLIDGGVLRPLRVGDPNVGLRQVGIECCSRGGTPFVAVVLRSETLPRLGQPPDACRRAVVGQHNCPTRDGEIDVPIERLRNPLRRQRAGEQRPDQGPRDTTISSR